MARKLYFSTYKDYEVCATIEVHIEYLKEHELKELELTEAKRIIGSEFFYCSSFNEVGDKGESHCGKDCGSYKPINGKSGKCKFNKPVYEPTDKKIIIHSTA